MKLPDKKKTKIPVRPAVSRVQPVKRVFKSGLARVKTTACKLEHVSFPWKAEELCNALRNETIELEALYELVPAVLDGDPTAEIHFRSWLLLEYDESADDPELDEAEEEYVSDSVLWGKSLGKTAPENHEFATAGIFLDICLTAAKIAVDDEDLEELNKRILCLLEKSEWFEEFNTAAAACDKTGDISEFERMARLYHRMSVEAPIESEHIDLGNVRLTRK
jgi:hypothetical protein